MTSIYSFGEKYDRTYLGFPGDREFYSKRAKDEEHVLYLGVGTGRIFSKVYSENPNAIGLDSSREMLDRLQNKFPTIKKDHLIRADIKKYKIKKNAFDLIIAPYAFLNFFSFEENASILKKIFGGLKRGGSFVTDFVTPFLNPPFNTKKEILIKRGLKTIIEYDHIKQEFHETNFYKKDSGETSLHNYYFYPNEIRNFFRMGGFKEVQIFGDYRSSELTTKSKLILVESFKL